MNPLTLLNSLPGALAQGLIWGIMAIGVAITYKILDYADLTVDNSLCTGGAVAAVCIIGGMNPLLALLCAVLAGALAGLCTGLLHTVLGIPAILSGILTEKEPLVSAGFAPFGLIRLPPTREGEWSCLVYHRVA